MMRLVERGLMYGGLVEIATPTLVERYNEGLEKLTGRRTELDSFYIDLSGFSPEIGEELGDDRYLNPKGCNRQFILVDLDQVRAPLLNAQFSSSRAILKRFYRENMQALFNLTSQDAVIGELLNSIYEVKSAEDLLNLRFIRVEAETTSGHVTRSRELNRLIEDFETREDGWYDDTLTQKMIDLAGEIGDIEHSPVALKRGPYEIGEFYTSHFGGVYVFRDRRKPVVLYSGRKPRGLSDLDVVAISLKDRDAVAAFLLHEELVETVFEAEGLNEVDLLQRRIDYVLMHHFGNLDPEWNKTHHRELRSAIYRDRRDLPDLFETLFRVLGQREQGGEPSPLPAGDPAYFYTLRAVPGPRRDLVNMLLAELTPLDPVQLFICHKPAFYAAYPEWPNVMQDHVVETLARDYIPNKADYRETLFGPVYDPDTYVPKNRQKPREKAQPWGKPR